MVALFLDFKAFSTLFRYYRGCIRWYPQQLWNDIESLFTISLPILVVLSLFFSVNAPPTIWNDLLVIFICILLIISNSEQFSYFTIFPVVFKDMSMKYLSTSFYGFFFMLLNSVSSLCISRILAFYLLHYVQILSIFHVVDVFLFLPISFFFTYFLCHTKSFCLFFYVVSFVYLALLSLPSSKITEDSRVHMLESFSCIFLTVFYPG